MTDIKKFDDFNLNEDKDDKNIDRDIFSHKLELVDNDDEQVQDDTKQTYFAKDDGWDKDKLDNVGLMEWLDEVQRFAYEINTCRRGSYAINGDTDKDLFDAIMSIKENLEYAVQNIDEHIDS